MTRVQLALRCVQVLPVALLCVWASLPAAESARTLDPSAGLIRYEAPGGEAFYALSIRAGGVAQAPAPRDHILLVDTSASQAGAHRDQQLAVVDGFLNSLSPADRVALLAVDVNVQPLSAGLVDAGSPALKTAVTALQRRVPLGATELLPGLQAALKTADGKRPTSVIYVGDGMSSARLIENAEMREVVEALRTREIPVSSFAVGPRTDIQLLGVLATHTGGVVIIDDLVNDKAQSPAELGRQLAQASAAPVYYTTRLTTQPELPNLLPSLPPVRSDRETVLMGEGLVPESVTVTVEARRAGQPVPTMTWTVKPAASSVANTFLGSVWSVAQRDQGLSFPLAGRELLNFARQTHEDIVLQLVTEGNKAVGQRNLRKAQEIAWQIRQIDPENVQSRVILDAAQAINDRVVAIAQEEEKPAVVNEAAPGEDPPVVQAPEAPADPNVVNEAVDPNLPPVDPNALPETEGTVETRSALETERELRRVRAQLRTQEVQQTLEIADQNKREQPDEVINQLKQTKSTIDSDAGIDADVRERLSRRLQQKILEVQGEKVRIEQLLQESQRREAQRQAERRTLDLMAEREEKLERRIEQVRALLARGFSGDESAFPEAESVARLAFELDPYSGITTAAVVTSEAAGQIDQAMRIRARRADRFLEALHQTELAHIPFPDEPPVVYPPAEVWQFLTQKRKKWESVDLVRNNPIEEKIRQSLSAATTVNFDQNPFEDAIKFVADQHQINIVIDKKTLEDDGIDTSTPITLRLDGVSLRSVLKLMLEGMELTYLIEDEVMKITTAASAAGKLSTRVYYVGDLVIPIVTVQASGIGQGLGGSGGFGGQNGAFGGGQFGVGGGGQFGNGQGGGMGFPCIAPEEIPEEFNNAVIKQRKKKL